MIMKWRWSSVAAGVVFAAAGALLWTQLVNALFVAPSFALRATEGKPRSALRAPEDKPGFSPGAAPAKPQTRVLSTSRGALDDTIERMRRRLAGDPGDGEAAVLLADALMRAARVRSDAALPLEAERVLQAALQHGRDY